MAGAQGLEPRAYGFGVSHAILTAFSQLFTAFISCAFLPQNLVFLSRLALPLHNFNGQITDKRIPHFSARNFPTTAGKVGAGGRGGRYRPIRKSRSYPICGGFWICFLFGCRLFLLYLFVDSCVDVCVHAQTVAGSASLYDFFFTLGHS